MYNNKDKYCKMKGVLMKEDKRYDHHDPKGHPEHRPDPEQEKKDKKKKRRRRKRRLIRWIILLLILIGHNP